jgi:phosphoadenosine phosphosulfate reductase
VRDLSPTHAGAGAPEPERTGGPSPTPAGDPAAELEGTLREALARHRGRLVLLCSFQKEESVLVDELARLLGEPGGDESFAAVRVVTIDTGVLFPETIETWRAFEQRFGIPIEVEDASGPWTGPEQCCSAAKVHALERALAGAEAWITGLRREQSPTRADALAVERDGAHSLLKYNPLASWTERDVWRRIHARNLPYNPLHDRGYASIGCAPCTLPGAGREGRWAGMEKTECGLHVPPAQAGAVPLGSGAGGAQGVGSSG